MKNQEKSLHWRYFELHMRMLFRQIIARPWSPIAEASGDDRLLLRLFRSLPEENQNEFLNEIGAKALLTVSPEIEEDDEEVDERIGNEIRSLMPDPPDCESFKQAIDTLDVTSIIFGSSRDDGEIEADLAAEAASYQDTCSSKFSPEQVQGYLAEWREKVVAEIEWRVASKKLDSASLECMRRERFEVDHPTDLLAQALAMVGGEIPAAPSPDPLKNATIRRDTMSVVEMANELHALLRHLENNHRLKSSVWTLRWEIMDLYRGMKEDPDQSLPKQVEYRKKMIRLLETLLED